MVFTIRSFFSFIHFAAIKFGTSLCKGFAMEFMIGTSFNIIGTNEFDNSVIIFKGGDVMG
jgi:hypothetical protein